MNMAFTTSSILGDHEIEVKYGGHPVTGSPFTCRAYDPTKIKVGNIPKGLLEKPVYFTGEFRKKKPLKMRNSLFEKNP